MLSSPPTTAAWPMVAHFILLVAITVSSVAAESTDPHRLDPGIRPITQFVHLWLNPTSESYTGMTRVEVQFSVATNRFRFHALSMELGATTLNGEPLTLTPSTQPPGWITATANQVIPAGVHVFESRFTNDYNRNGVGLYKAVSDGRPYLFTQFEATDARQAFPCWDEPGFKIPWRITVTAPDGIRVIGNMPAAETTSREGTTTFEFGRTPPMPSYLVALALGPLDTLAMPDLAIPGRIVTAAGQTNLARMASVHIPPILSALERYFGIPYPYPKLDHLALPALPCGAMENAGAITYRDEMLLVDDGHATIEQKRLLPEVTAHEMAHQWFGNLVTLQWWDDLWLNEAFATWASFKIARQLYPDLHFELRGHQIISVARTTDTQPSVKPIRRNLGAADNVHEAVDVLTYFKGMAILSMAESWMGDEAFRSAVQSYFRSHAWGSTRADDLWKALSEFSDASLTETVRRYIEQPGIPELTFRRLPGNRLEVSQQRYKTLIGDKVADFLWQVPIVVTYGVGSDTRTARHLLTGTQQVFEIPDLDRAEWLYPNSNAAGYYLWNLSPELTSSLLDKGLIRLGSLERLGLLQSANFAVSSGKTSPVDALRLALASARDPRSEIRSAVMRSLIRWREILPVADQAAYAPLLRQTLRPMLDDIGFEPRNDDSSEVETLRSDLITHLGIIGEDPEVIAFCREAGKRQLENPQSVPAPIATATLTVATWLGDEAWSRQLRRAHEAANQPDVRIRFQTHLAAFRDPDLARDGMDYALTDAVPGTNVGLVIAGRPELAATRLAWLEKNFDRVKAKVAADGFDEWPGILTGADLTVLERARKSFQNELRARPLAELRFREVTDATRLDLELGKRHAEAMRAFLKNSVTQRP
ncbi:MAG: M1 family metallopeptidase [Verrucomicrobiales bacterium]|nr:M1 family metallopeptidase [Verrucomicrobiales bacterium]